MYLLFCHILKIRSIFFVISYKKLLNVVFNLCNMPLIIKKKKIPIDVNVTNRKQ